MDSGLTGNSGLDILEVQVTVLFILLAWEEVVAKLHGSAFENANSYVKSAFLVYSSKSVLYLSTNNKFAILPEEL